MSIQQIICILNGIKYYTLKFHKNEIVNCKIIYEKLKKKVQDKRQTEKIKGIEEIHKIDDYYFQNYDSGKMINIDLNEDFSDNPAKIIMINSKLRGGNPVMKIIMTVIGAVTKFFEEVLFGPILKPIMMVVKVMYIVFILVPIYSVKLLIWTFRFMLWFVLEVANPLTLINDFVGTIKMLTLIIVGAVFELLKSFPKKILNTTTMTVFQGLWGWDKVIADEWDYKYSEYHNCKQKCRGAKCYKTNSGQVPFSILIGAVICPPIGVFMEYGLTGWINILICVLLTAAFYFPGLIYALIVLYC